MKKTSLTLAQATRLLFAPIARLLLLIVIAQACIAPQKILTQEQLKQIPTGASTVVVETNYTIDELFTMVAQGMAKDGWRVNVNREIHQITTEPRNVEEGTTVSATIFFEEDKEGAIMTIRGTWGVDATMAAALSGAFGAVPVGQNEAKMSGSLSSREAIAFQHLAQIGYKVPDAVVLFRK